MLKSLAYILLAGASISSYAQVLSTSATISDSDGTTWANGSYSIQIYSPNGTPYYNGTPVPTAPITGVLNGSGAFSGVSLYNTSTITPVNAQYTFILCSKTSAPCSIFNTPVTITNLTSTLVTLVTAPRFIAAYGSYGYADAEIISPGIGSIYTNITTGPRYYNGSAWTATNGSGGASTSTTYTATSLVGGGVASFNGPSGPSCGSPSFGNIGSSTAGYFSSIGFVVCQSGSAYEYLTNSIARYAVPIGWTNGDTTLNGSDAGFRRLGTGNVGCDSAEAGAGTPCTLQVGFTSNPLNTIASAGTIAPTASSVVITGTAAIATITPPTGLSATNGGCMDVLATGAWTTTTGGNIFATMTAVANTQYRFCYLAVGGTPKWYVK